jgi:DTW domain-containing protein YfiP
MTIAKVTSSNPTKHKNNHTNDEDECFTLEHIHNLGHLASSTERFAKSNGMTPNQVREVLQARRQASVDLQSQLQELDLDDKTKGNTLIECSTSEAAINNQDIQERKKQIGKLKHQLICHHRHTHFRNPFVCKSCWTHRPICICPSFPNKKLALPQGVKEVIVWTHHEEWGRTANTGSLLPLGLENTQLLMKGLEEHDIIWKEMLENEAMTPVVLWPGKGEGDNTTVTLSGLKQRIRDNTVRDKTISSIDDNKERESDKSIILISIEGTWNNARKMVNKLPSHFLRLDIGDAISSFYSSPNTATSTATTLPASKRANLPPPISSSPSLLAPLRRQGKGKFGTETNVSTLEATIIALIGLGLDEVEGRSIVEKAKEKVWRIREFTGKVHSRA